MNIDAHNEQEVDIELGSLSTRMVTGRILRSGKLQDHNSFDVPAKVAPASFTNTVLTGSNLTVKVPPFSVLVLALK